MSIISKPKIIIGAERKKGGSKGERKREQRESRRKRGRKRGKKEERTEMWYLPSRTPVLLTRYMCVCPDSAVDILHTGTSTGTRTEVTMTTFPRCVYGKEVSQLPAGMFDFLKEENPSWW